MPTVHVPTQPPVVIHPFPSGLVEGGAGVVGICVQYFDANDPEVPGTAVPLQYHPLGHGKPLAQTGAVARERTSACDLRARSPMGSVMARSNNPAKRTPIFDFFFGGGVGVEAIIGSGAGGSGGGTIRESVLVTGGVGGAGGGSTGGGEGGVGCVFV